VKRRRFLEATSAGAAALLWPAWLREAFADEPACDKGWAARVAQVAAAFARGREAGKQLLVFVIPADDAEKWTRGETFGELLNHGADRDLAPLAGVEVACATMADLKKIVPTAGAGEPLMVLIDPSRVPATARQVDTDLSAYPNLYEGRMSWEEREKAEDEISDRHIAAMGKMLRDALGAAPGDDRRAAALAADVRARLRDKPLPGSRWARASGCGVRIEGDTDSMGYACGMGHTPKKSQRFLYFFTKRF
jgi:hypothetical protein